MTTRKTAKTTTRRSAAAAPSARSSGTAKRVSKSSPAAKTSTKSAPKPVKASAAKRSTAKPTDKSVAETVIESSRLAAMEAIKRSEASSRKHAELASAAIEAARTDTEAVAEVFSESLAEPVQALSTLTLENTGKLVDIQMTAFRRYSELVLGEAREMTALDDAEAVQAFMLRQGETMRSLTNAAAEDFNAMTRIGLDFFQAAGAILNRSMVRPV
jgi:hypothetical protein